MTISPWRFLWRYVNLKKVNIGLDESVFMFALRGCIELGCLDFGRGVHVDAFKFGLNVNPFVGSSLIGLYSKHGNIGDAYKAFDEISGRDVVVYTSMITGYALVGDGHGYDAFNVVRKMQQEGLDPNRVTLVSLLGAVAQVEALKEGRSIHGYAIRRGIGYLEKVFETSLVDMYVKCGDLRMAVDVFGGMKVRDIGSWNAMMAGYLKMEYQLEALDLFRVMLQEKIMPDLITLSNVLLCCADLKCLREGKSIHCYIIRMGSLLDIVITTALVDMYSQCNHLLQAKELFDTSGTRDVILYDVMMAGYLENGLACEARKIFSEMVRTRIKPNIGSVLSVLSASSDLKDMKAGRCIHGYILRRGYYASVEVANQIIYLYANSSYIAYATRVFNMLRNRDLVSWTSLMMGCIHYGQANKSITLFRLMQKERVDYDSTTLTCLIQAFCQLGWLSLAKEVHCHLYRALVETDIPVMNSLITTYAKCGKLDMARNLFEGADKKCLTSWNTMIAAYGSHGNCADALKLFGSMKRYNVEPDEVTFTSLLTACSHSGLVEDGLRVFRSMTKDYSIKPCEEHYGCMVDLLSRAGQLKEAYDLIVCLPSKQRASALSSLLSACQVHGNTEMGELIGEHLLNLEPDNAGAYTLMSNIYAEGGKWDEATEIRAKAKSKGLKKTYGYSMLGLR
uniref:Pentatricopeptide repeat-containing protein At3g57430ic n=1 Tax=Rhizophora mucronata TaxID=61149 RepID=A0A2P2Q603_RHIMU